MRKFVLFLILTISLGMFIGCSNNEEHRYSSMEGKDTIESFGDDGRFGIFKTSKSLDLYDCISEKGTIDFITKYKKIEPYVYTIGKEGYTKLNYKNAEIKQSNNLSEFSNEDQEIFKNLENE